MADCCGVERSGSARCAPINGSWHARLANATPAQLRGRLSNHQKDGTYRAAQRGESRVEWERERRAIQVTRADAPFAVPGLGRIAETLCERGSAAWTGFGPLLWRHRLPSTSGWLRRQPLVHHVLRGTCEPNAAVGVGRRCSCVHTDGIRRTLGSPSKSRSYRLGRSRNS